MLLHKRKPFFIWGISFSLLISCITYTQESVPQPSILSVEEQEALEMAGKCEQVFQNTYQLKNILIQIASVISTLRDGIIKDKKAAHKFITDWNMALDTHVEDIVRAVQTQQPVEELQLLIGTLLEASIKCADDVSHAMKNNFIDACYTPFEPQKSTMITLEYLDVQLKKFEELFVTLSNDSLSIGITFTNKVARKVDDMLSWCSRNNIGKWVAFVGGASLLGTYLFWHEKCYKSCNYIQENGNWVPSIHKLSTDSGTIMKSGQQIINELDNSWSNWLLKKVNGAFGCPPARNTVDGSYDLLDSDKGFINSFDKFINNGIGGKFTPLFYTVNGFFSAYVLKTIHESTKPWLNKRLSSMWNHLRGGAYTDKKVEGVFEFYPTTTFNDIIGMQEYKDRFSVLIEYCVHPEQFKLANNKPCTRIAFTGPTRTGKTYLAYALCGEIKAAILRAGKELNFRFLNVPGGWITAKGMSTIMEHARSVAPCVIFIDEVDLCGLQRSGNTALLMDALTELGQENPNADPLKPVITIVATNKLENLDTALFTPARLGEDIRFDYPCIQDRLAYIVHTLEKAGINPKQFDIERFAQKLNGKSYEDMSRFITAARSKALIRKQPITQELLERCIDEEIRRIIFFNNKVFPKSEMLLLSAHYAGQALAMALLKEHHINMLDMVTINPFMPKIIEEVNSGTGRESWQPKILVGKMFTRPLCDTTNLLTREQIINQIKCMVAGSVAEEIIFGYPSSNLCEQESLSRAYEWTKQLTFGGLWKGQLADAIYNKLSEEAHNLFVDLKKEVKVLLEQHREQLNALIHALMKYRTLSDYEIYAIMENPQIIYQIDQQNASTSEAAEVSA